MGRNDLDLMAHLKADSSNCASPSPKSAAAASALDTSPRLSQSCASLTFQHRANGAASCVMLTGKGLCFDIQKYRN